MDRIGDSEDAASEADTATSSPHETHGQPPPPDTGAVAPIARKWDYRDDGASGDAQPRTWRQALPRWLATLDSKRTRREYEKAALYFFQAPGVPELLSDLTFDLLLAYRGSLALRAERQTTRATHSGPSRRPAMPSDLAAGELSGVPSGWQPVVDQRDPAQDDVDSGDAAGQGGSGAGPLAPATVNVRLTALRQFLAHCSLWGLVPQLSPERIHAALRRLSIERRRPYQILAEPEWASFLNAARSPAIVQQQTGERAVAGTHERPDAKGSSDSLAPNGSPDTEWADHQAKVWGTPRAVRRRLAAEQTSDSADPAAHVAAADTPRVESPSGTVDATRHTQAWRATATPVRSKAGLTGVRTAQRDHALLALALATGLRAIELCGLDLGDLAREWHAGREEWWLVLPDAKTKGQRGGRTLPLAPALVQTLFEYVRSTGRQWENAADRSTPLFLSHRRSAASDHDPDLRPHQRPLSPAQVRYIVDRVETQWVAATSGTAYDARENESRALSPHALRHSTAVALLEGNERTGRAPASVEHVRGWLGHLDIRTTQGYLAHVDSRRHRRPFALQPLPEIPLPTDNDSGSTIRPSDET